VITKFLVAIAVLAVSPAFVCSQDLFVLFDQGADASNATTATTADESGSAYIYSSFGFDYDAIILDFSSSDSSVFQVTGGELFNPTFTIEGFIGCARFTPGTDVRRRPPLNNFGLVAISLGAGLVDLTNASDIQNTFGIRSSLVMYDPGFDPSVGPNGAFLLARVDFDIVGEGTANLELGLPWDDLSVALIGQADTTYVFPTLGAATLTVGPAVVDLGDVNLDGAANFLDISSFIDVISAGTFQAEVDCNQDGYCDLSDITPFIECMSGH
jgi:hypothetical protein